MSTIIVTNNNDSGASSLREAITNAQSGDTIKFDASLANQTITLTSGQIEIAPGKEIIIDGADVENLTISGNNTSRIFHLDSNVDFISNLTLKNLNITEGYTTEYGGAILTEHLATLTIENVNFDDNVADLGGGAIYVSWEGTLTINDSNFDGNEAIASNDERGAGAITFLSPNDITIINSDFTNNKGINGGAINSLNGNLTIENSRFINNDTTSGFYDTGNPRPFLRGFGGALYADRASTGSDDTSGTISITNSLFSGNSGRGEGGAAYLYTGRQDNVIISDTLFENNQVLALDGGAAGSGGAVAQQSDGSNEGLTLTNSTFVNNTAGNQGGGLWVQNATTTISNSTFSGNQTLDQTPSSVGGAITVYSPTQIINTTIVDNHAGWVAGGLAANDSEVTIKDSIFYNNTADNGGNDWGIQQHSNREFTDLGGNFQYPPKATNNFNDYNVTATIETTVDPQLEPLQDNGASVPTHAVGNPVVVNSGAIATENPIDESPIDEIPVDESPVDEIPIDESPIDESPIDENPVDESPIDENPVDENPIDEIPVDESPIDDDFELVAPYLKHQDDNSFTIKSPESVQLNFQLLGNNSEQMYEIGIFSVEDEQGSVNGLTPVDEGYLQTALSQLQTRVIFSTLHNQPNSFEIQQSRIVEGLSNNRFVLYLVEGGSTNGVLSGDISEDRVIIASTFTDTTSLSLQVEELENGAYQLYWFDQNLTSKGNPPEVFLSLEITQESIPIGTALQGKPEKELIDLRLETEERTASFTVQRDAAYDNVAGLYTVDDEFGTVDGIVPGEEGYAQAALARRLDHLELFVENGETKTSFGILDDGVILAPYIITDGNVDEFLQQNPDNSASEDTMAYFIYQGANPDGKDHIRLFGDNTFGFEDTFNGGDGDFNDLVIEVGF